MRSSVALVCVACLVVSVCFSQSRPALSTSGASQPADYRDRSVDVSSIDTGLLIAGCAIAGGSIITSLLLPSPTPEFFLEAADIPSQQGRLMGLNKPVKISHGDSVAYGMVQSVDATTLRLKTRNDEKLLAGNEINYIIDLSSAARKSRMSKVKTAILLGGGGVGVCLVAASQKSTSTSSSSVDNASSTSKTLLYAAGGCLIAGGLWSLLSHADDEQELQAWEAQNSQGLSHSSSFFDDVQVRVALMPVKRISPSTGIVTELIPCIQAKVGLDF